MVGFAQKKYLKEHKAFWKLPVSSLLESLRDKGFVQTLDCISAKLLAGELFNENSELLFAYLFAASRQGHLCVQLSGDLYPRLDQIWTSDGAILSSQELDELNRKIIQGFKALPSSFFCMHPHLVLEDSLLYLQKNWFYEREVWDAFKNWEASVPVLQSDHFSIGTSLLPKQKNAVQTALKYSLSFITGGPGVGKTFTASHLIRSFIKEFPHARVALVAPTGKAVANLQSHFIEFTENQEESSNIEVYTLHKLFSQKVHSFLAFDLILVDESSMIDLGFMRQLLKYAKPGSRLIFLGDPNQLPPIESGFIFQDLLKMSTCQSHLSECIRVEHQELIEAAQFVNEGDEVRFLNFAEPNKLLFPLDIQKKEAFYTHLLSFFPKNSSSLSSLELLSAYQTFKVLSPLRKGPFGVDQINYNLGELLSKEPVQPILITTNDYSLELFNGDVGVLVNQEYAYFYPRKKEESYYESEKKVRVIPKALLPSYEQAYCVSVHKSQGSEYQQVAIILPPTSEVFGKEMLYTAITRAKKHFEIFCDLTTLKKIFKVSAIRCSGTQARKSDDKNRC